MRSPRPSSRGATLVEAAFAVPILLLLLLGLVDFGLLAFENNQVSNAARDGARVGILSYKLADVDGSTDNQRISDTILANLPSGSISSLDVSCVQPDATAIDCDDALIDQHLLRVDVSWEYDFVSPVANALGFNTRTLNGTAQMTLIGTPGAVTPASTTTTTLACSVSSVTVTLENGNPSDPSNRVGVLTAGSAKGNLDSDLTVTVATNGSPACSSLMIEFRGPDYPGPADSHLVADCGCSSPYVYAGDTDKFWDDAVADGAVVVLDGPAEVASASIYLDHP